MYRHISTVQIPNIGVQYSPTSIYFWSGLMAVLRARVLASSMEINLVGVDMARDFGRHFFGVPSTPLVE